MRYKVVLAAALVVITTGCMSVAPRSFAPNIEPQWYSIEVREGMKYEDAWQDTFGLLARSFDIETAMQHEGYIRTAWTRDMSARRPGGAANANQSYMVRVTVKFAKDRKTLHVRPEASVFMRGAPLQVGTDSRLSSLIKTDLMGVLSRTTR